jgi:hypothetical protein
MVIDLKKVVSPLKFVDEAIGPESLASVSFFLRFVDPFILSLFISC